MSFTPCRECRHAGTRAARDEIQWEGEGDRDDAAALAVGCFLNRPHGGVLRVRLRFDDPGYSVRDAASSVAGSSVRLDVEESLRRHGLTVVRDNDPLRVDFVGGDLAQRAAIRKVLDEALGSTEDSCDLTLDVGLWEDGATPVVVTAAVANSRSQPQRDLRSEVRDLLTKKGFRATTLPTEP